MLQVHYGTLLSENGLLYASDSLERRVRLTVLLALSRSTVASLTVCTSRLQTLESNSQDQAADGALKAKELPSSCVAHARNPDDSC